MYIQINREDLETQALGSLHTGDVFMYAEGELNRPYMILCDIENRIVDLSSGENYRELSTVRVRVPKKITLTVDL